MVLLEAVALTAMLEVLVLLGKDLLVAVVSTTALAAVEAVHPKQVTLTDKHMVAMGYKVV